MPLHSPTLVLLALALVPLAGCGKRDDTASDPLAGRLDGLERRFDAIDQRLAGLEKQQSAAERLRDDVRLLEQRLTGAEAKATQALETAKTAKTAATLPPVAPSGAQAATHPGERPDLLDRRAALADLATDYRRKLSELAKQQGAAGADPMERAAARREVRAWYIARRRAILRGQPLPDAGAP
jgi:hypothetical protein